MMERRYQRWLAVGLLIVFVLVIVSLVVVPLVSSALEYREQKNDLLFRLNRQRSIAARKDSAANALESIKQQFEELHYFSSEETEALVSAELQNIVKTAVTSAGGQLTSTQGLPSKMEAQFAQVAVKVRMTGSMETVANVLQNIEQAVPLLAVTQFDATPVRGLHNPVTNRPEPSPLMNVSFDVVSFMRNKSNE